jgi:hypothetical protein
MVQTCLEVFVSDILIMAEAILMIVLIYGMLSYYFQPYLSKRQNMINVVSSFACMKLISMIAFVTIYLAAIILTL